MSELEPYRSSLDRFSRRARKVVMEARIKALQARGSELLAMEMMDSVVRVDKHRTSLPSDSDALNAMLIDIAIGHHQVCTRIQANLYKWDV